MAHGEGRETGTGAGPGVGAAALRLGLVVVLVAILAHGLILAIRALSPTLRSTTSDRKTTEAGVYFVAGSRRLELGGFTPYEVTGALEEVAPSQSRLPVDAYVDRSTRGVVPELDGRRLDVAAITAAALEARPGERVHPLYYATPARVSLLDFPQAPVYHGNTAKNEVAILLNIAWGDEYLDGIRDLVEESGGRLTICPTGLWLEGSAGRAAWLGEAVRRGHDVGNHGYYNQPMTYQAAKVREELARTSDLIRSASGRESRVFAPPMGAIDEPSLAAVATDGYRVVLWSLDTIDWRLEGAETIADRVKNRVRAGDIILCHPTPQTAPAMKAFLPALAEKGLRVVTLTQLLSPRMALDADTHNAVPPSPDGASPAPPRR